MRDGCPDRGGAAQSRAAHRSRSAHDNPSQRRWDALVSRPARLIQVTSRYVVEQERLKLSDDSGVEMLVFLPQSQELAGSTWIVESYNDGDSPGRGVIENSIAKILFTEDGSISGGVSCNSFTGKYTAKDGVLAIEPLAITEMGCLEPAGTLEQETALVEAVESAVSYWVDGNRLHLKTENGTAAAELVRG